MCTPHFLPLCSPFIVSSFSGSYHLGSAEVPAERVANITSETYSDRTCDFHNITDIKGTIFGSLLYPFVIYSHTLAFAE